MFIKKERIISLIVLLFIVSSCQSQIKQSPEDKTGKIHELINLYSEYGGFNGSILVASKGEIIYQNGFGLANMEWDIPNEVDTKFRIASLTKQFTAMLIMQLVAENKLDLYKPISTYLPDYPNENTELITIHHLLTHSSGIPNANSTEKAFRPKDLVNQFANEPLQFIPGERFEYSNSGYNLLGYIIETVTGKSYDEVLKDRIFIPLKMNNSGFYAHTKIIKNMSSGYNKGFGEYFDVDNSDASSPYSAGGIYSTVEDLFLWDQALYQETLLSKKYMDMIFTEHISDPGYGGFYGYGWELIDKKVGNTDSSISTIGHGGNINGYRAYIQRIPSSKSTTILLSNTDYAFLLAISRAILGILEEKPYDYPLKPIAKFMTKVIESEGIEKGISFYKEHQDLPEYYVSEEELIVEGYRFLHDGNANFAAEIFKLSTEVFPNKDNPFDSYAEALMALGKNEAAIENYKKSLQLNPNNRNAEKMLKKLGAMGK